MFTQSSCINILETKHSKGGFEKGNAKPKGRLLAIALSLSPDAVSSSAVAPADEDEARERDRRAL